jgi:hypothetical protein
MQQSIWRELAPKPTTNQYVDQRQGYGDGLHVVVVDDTGDNYRKHRYTFRNTFESFKGS